MVIRDILSSSKLPKVESELLVAHVLGKNRTWVVAHVDDRLNQKELQRFHLEEARRMKGEPIAYITEKKEFYGREFLVSPSVLIPRPATEGLVGEALFFLKNPQTREEEVDSGISVLTAVLHPGTPRIIVDVGTGSGAVAITLALEGVTQKIIAVDTSEEALVVAKKNAETLRAYDKIEFALVDGIEHVKNLREPFMVVSNPPYIPVGEELERDVVDFEPHEALFAGEDGLDVIIPLVEAAKANKKCTGIVMELRSDQVEAVASLL